MSTQNGRVGRLDNLPPPEEIGEDLEAALAEGARDVGDDPQNPGGSGGTAVEENGRGS